MSGLKHVYILGAGFSMPLGGPSFNQLISAREQDFVRSQIKLDDPTPSERLLFRMNDLVASLWEAIGRNPDRSGRYQEVNIEEILETIDYCEKKPNSTIAKTVMHSAYGREQEDGFAELNRLIRVRLAMSTLLFLEIVPDESERWSPYKRWFSGLTKDDTILTFNYDNVVERAAELAGRPYYDSKQTCNPTLLMDSADNPALLKLHGSATWLTSANLENVVSVHDSQGRIGVAALGRFS